MSLYHSKVIVLRSRNLGEADRVLLLLSEADGKFEAVVKGARRQRSRFVGNTLSFNLLNGLFFTGNSLDQLSQAELIHSFGALRDNLEKLAYASFWVELADAFLPEREAVPEIFRFLLAALLTLEKTEVSALLNLAFQIRLLNYLGYQPHLGTCVNCGSQAKTDRFFSAAAGGLICASCREAVKDLLPITESDLRLWRELNETDLRRLEGVNCPESNSQAIRRMLRLFIEARLDHALKSQVFLDQVLS